jgi:hypothetical protein
MRRTMTLVAIGAVLTAGAVGFRLPNDPPPGVMVTDSAGVQIVETRAPLWETHQRAAWRVDTAPLLDLGISPPQAVKDTFATPRGYVAMPRSTVRAADVFTDIAWMRRLDDSSLAVLDGRDLKFFSDNGVHITTLREPGRGPGDDMLGAKIIPYRRDSLLVFETSGVVASTQVRAYVLDLTGRHGRVIKETIAVPFSLSSDRVTSDGGFVVTGKSLETRPESTSIVTHTTFYHVTPDVRRVDSIATLVVDRRDLFRDAFGFWEPPVFRSVPPPAVVHDRSMYWGDGSRFEFTVFDLAPLTLRGQVRTRIVRSTRPPTPATESDRAAYIERRYPKNAPGRDPAAPARIRSLETRALGATLPAFTRLLVDAAANVWLENYRHSMPAMGLPNDPTDIARWTVFDSAGVMLGDVVLPRGLAVTSIGPDWVLGTARDERLANHVRMYRLRK